MTKLFGSFGFGENQKKSENGRFLVIFWANFGMFLISQSYDFDVIAHAGASLAVK